MFVFLAGRMRTQLIGLDHGFGASDSILRLQIPSDPTWKLHDISVGVGTSEAELNS